MVGPGPGEPLGPALLGLGAPTMEAMAAAKPAVNFGSLASAAVTVSTIGGGCGRRHRNASGICCCCNCRMRASVEEDCVRSSVTVGKGAEAESVAAATVRSGEAEAYGKGHCRPAMIESLRLLLLAEPESSMEAAAAVVFAMTAAVRGSGWLWLPSYVVSSTSLSSAHLCTYTLTVSPITTAAAAAHPRRRRGKKK